MQFLTPTSEWYPLQFNIGKWQQVIEFRYRFWLGWFSINNNLTIIYNNITNLYYKNQRTEYCQI
jgi:hypothetical protein